MNKKIIVACSIAVVLSIAITTSMLLSNDNENLGAVFYVDAVYFEQNKIIEITFEDKSEKTNLVTLEILGMNESFQRKIDSSIFVERVPLSSQPKYGWSSMPVTFVVEHEDLGKIGIKTEIHAFGETKPRVIFSRL